MAFADHFSTQANAYAAFRPSYPDALGAHLVSLSPSPTQVWDCATGSGQAATMLARHFDDYEAEAGRCLNAKLALPAYDQVLKCSHMFNLLDGRRAIAVTDRQAYILRMRALAMRVARMMVGEDDA